VFTVRNVICGILLFVIMWGVKSFAQGGVYSDHGHLFFVACMIVLLAVGYIIDSRERRAARQRPPGY
jgi:drug/metabolite transporter (DMT)-like permease